jgi:hypothetical protein
MRLDAAASAVNELYRARIGAANTSAAGIIAAAQGVGHAATGIGGVLAEQRERENYAIYQGKRSDYTLGAQAAYAKVQEQFDKTPPEKWQSLIDAALAKHNADFQKGDAFKHLPEKYRQELEILTKTTTQQTQQEVTKLARLKVLNNAIVSVRKELDAARATGEIDRANAAVGRLREMNAIDAEGAELENAQTEYAVSELDVRQFALSDPQGTLNKLEDSDAINKMHWKLLPQQIDVLKTYAQQQLNKKIDNVTADWAARNGAAIRGEQGAAYVTDAEIDGAAFVPKDVAERFKMKRFTAQAKDDKKRVGDFVEVSDLISDWKKLKYNSKEERKMRAQMGWLIDSLATDTDRQNARLEWKDALELRGTGKDSDTAQVITDVRGLLRDIRDGGAFLSPADRDKWQVTKYLYDEKDPGKRIGDTRTTDPTLFYENNRVWLQISGEAGIEFGRLRKEKGMTTEKLRVEMDKWLSGRMKAMNDAQAKAALKNATAPGIGAAGFALPFANLFDLILRDASTSGNSGNKKPPE